jgi:trans-aconitate 2-methyltransferase
MWNPEQYERFKAERRQPFSDLMALVERRPRMRVLDLGCGTGELTRALHDHLGAEETTGIDNSETMLLKSSEYGNETLHFEQTDIVAFAADRPFDLIFSNAALHWVPDHEALLRKLTALLAPAGQLAVQMPANDDHPTHAIAAELAREYGVDSRPSHLLRTEHYAELLHQLGFARQNVRMQVYGHLLPSAEEAVEWVKGTLLTDYERRIGSERYPAFLRKYRERVVDSLPSARPYFYTYKRILFWGSF